MLTACKPVQKTTPSLSWKVAAEIPPENSLQKAIGYAGPVAGTHNGVLFIGGGANFPDAMPWLGGAKKYHDVLWVFHPKDNTFSKFQWPQTIAYPASVSTGAGVVSMGGENENGIVGNVWLTKWENNQPVITPLPSLPVAVTNAAAAVSGNFVYVAGGETSEAASAQFMRLNINGTAKGWEKLPDLPKPLSHTVLLAQGAGPDEKIFLIGGRAKTISGISNLYNDVYEFNIAEGKWNVKASLPYALCAGTGAVVNNDYLVMFGGDKGETFHKAETIIAKINAEKDSVIKEQLIKEKIQIQSTHPGFSKELLWYDIKNDKWVANGIIPFDVPATTTAVKMGDKVFIPSGEIKAGVRSPKILEAHP